MPIGPQSKLFPPAFPFPYTFPLPNRTQNFSQKMGYNTSFKGASIKKIPYPSVGKVASSKNNTNHTLPSHYFISTMHFTPFASHHCPKQISHLRLLLLPVSHFWHVQHLICLLAWIIYTSAQPGSKIKVFMQGHRQAKMRHPLWSKSLCV